MTIFSFNSLETESFGGNITTSISDHFSQFCKIDILKKAKHASVPLKQRTFRNFNDDEFINEINKGSLILVRIKIDLRFLFIYLIKIGK